MKSKDHRPHWTDQTTYKFVKPGEIVQVPEGANPADITKVLNERGERYGKFIDHADVTQELKNVIRGHMGERWHRLAADQKEALEMIAHKLGRIINGDPDYADSWVDIAGYAKLIADRLEGIER